MSDEAANREAYRLQHHYCTAMGAPITARICLALADCLSRDSRTGARALDWEGEPTKAALPLRTVGGLHSLALRGVALVDVFDGTITDPEAVKAALSAALSAHDGELYPWLDGPPQTNEAGRSGALMCGLIEVSRRFGQPLEILEIGSSAGLNLLIDRYRFDLGGTTVGPEDAPVTIRPEWRGPVPPRVPVRFASVRGCDQAIVDVRDAAAAERLRAYVWADNPERQARMTGAIAMIAAQPVQLEEADAAEWLEARLAEPQAEGVTRVLMHSVVWQYLPAQTQAKITGMMEEAGAAATADKPLAWVEMEPDRTLHRQEVRVRTWPDGAPGVMVAASQAHGAWVEGWTANIEEV
ncbi:MAG: DUF2332 domain-containing protein [Sphingomonas sp.]|uniref:DUF2332 domain-containing protein n=1 Tax=Sphingomonas sp. TaxID=28214 RepID=UPI0025F396A9|nr:DUF2332 domain-containing protein [Sphingomonas sp.]MBX3563481.1 DUF2332 domain-containing protein [Sphingomonas sp.]